MIIVSIVIMLLFCSGAALTIHEAGHYLAAKFFRQDLMFAFEWGLYTFTMCGRDFTIKIPRLTSKMPDIALWQQRIIAASGFGFEFLAALALIRFDREILAMYLIVCFAHLITYKYYCGEDNDFSYFVFTKGGEK